MDSLLRSSATSNTPISPTSTGHKKRNPLHTIPQSKQQQQRIEEENGRRMGRETHIVVHPERIHSQSHHEHAQRAQRAVLIAAKKYQHSIPKHHTDSNSRTSRYSMVPTQRSCQEWQTGKTSPSTSRTNTTKQSCISMVQSENSKPTLRTAATTAKRATRAPIKLQTSSTKSGNTSKRSPALQSPPMKKQPNSQPTSPNPHRAHLQQNLPR